MSSSAVAHHTHTPPPPPTTTTTTTTTTNAPASSSSSILHTSSGDYAVGEEIGRGSFATVYIGRRVGASSTPSAALAAIKTVNRDKLNRKLAENLETEIKILKGIRHDHIVGLMDIV
ncbi:Serine/threonine-protein kinase, partial [Dinochytrium kinnereticum]